MATYEVEFLVNTPSDPTDTLRRQRKIAVSHAARSAHAKTRREQTIRYQAQKLRDYHARHKIVPATQAINMLPASRKDPFVTFARSLDHVEPMLFDHCTYFCIATWIRTVTYLLLLTVVTNIIPLMRCEERAVSFTHRMTTIWVPFALTEASLLDLLFLISCRHLSATYTIEQQQQLFTRLAIQYKLKCIRSLRDTISGEPTSLSNSAVAQAIMLAYDEVGHLP